MKKLVGSTLFLLIGIGFLGVGAVEFYRTTISPRIHVGD